MIGSLIKRISPFKSPSSSDEKKTSRGKGGNTSRSSDRKTKSGSRSKSGASSKGRHHRTHDDRNKQGDRNKPDGRHNQSTSGKKQSGHHKSASKKHNKSSRSPKTETAVKDNWSLDQFQVAPEEGKTRFHDLDLPLPLMHAIADLGFEYCSPIQAKALPYTLNGQDVVGKAQTGTGKTAAFLVGIIDDLIRHPLEQRRYAGEARALIIAPTRELVIQIAEDAKKLCKYTDLEIHTLVGGMDYGKQQRRLHQSFVDILVATPGRLMDFVSSRDVYLDQVEVLVVDEADRMLDMGFIPQVRRIVRSTPRKSHRQTLLFSATFTDDVLHLAEQWTEDPVRIEIEPEKVANSTVTQHVYLASSEEKYTLLYNILQQENVESLIVFSNRRDECRRLHEQLKAHGFSVGILSGDVAQNQRVKTLNGFKEGKLNVLVATDVAGRGIHIEGISHVVNFTLPEEPEDYVHRIGRTGRAGKEGTSISFACEDDAFRLMPIKELVGEDLHCEMPPEHLLIEAPEAVRTTNSQSRYSAGRRPQNRGGARHGGSRRGSSAR